MSRNYYYLVAGLPELLFGQTKRPFDLLSFKTELRNFLHPFDYQLVELLFVPYDHTNLLNTLQKKAALFNSLGNYSQDELEDAIRESAGVPEYIRYFIERYREESGEYPGPWWENLITSRYYDFIESSSCLFLRSYFEFDRSLRNIMSAHICRKYGLPADEELVGQNDVTDALRKSQARDFGLSGELDFMERLMTLLENPNLLEREKGVDLLRWNHVDELTTFHYFSIEVVLGYVIKLQIVDRWMRLDKPSGEKLFGRLQADLKDSYQFSTEYTIHERRQHDNG
jgi:hypothetical protein